MQWTGQYIYLSDAACPAGTQRVSAFDGKFIRGSATYGGTGGGTTHTHDASGTSDGPSSTSWARTDGGDDILNNVHPLSGTSNQSILLPPFYNVTFCSITNVTLPSSAIVMSNTSSITTGFSRFSGLDSRFPLGSGNPSATSGATTHQHTLSVTLTDPGWYGAESLTFGTEIVYSGHTHTVSGITSSTTPSPPFLGMIFQKASPSNRQFPGVIVITNITPPLGWVRYSSLDSTYPVGNTTYGVTGGSSTHTHTLSTGASSDDGTSGGEWTLWGSGWGIDSDTHTHTITSQPTTAASNDPPYIDVLFIYRKLQTINATPGAEMPAGIVKPGSFGLSMNTTKYTIQVNRTTINDSLSTGWNHIAMVVNRTHIAIYTNGTLNRTMAYTGPIPSNSYALFLGTGMNGTIDDFRLWNRSLSSEQIKLNHYFGSIKQHVMTIHSDETNDSETWYVNVTPSDGWVDGNTNMSTPLTLVMGSVLTAPTDTYTAALTVVGNASGVLVAGSEYTVGQNITFAYGGKNLTRLMALFNQSSVDLSKLIIQNVTGKISINTSGVTGIAPTHTLYLPVNNRVGIYVCPGANTTDQVTPGCEGQLNFTYDEAVATTRKSGVTVSIDNNYWVIQNLTGSGGGDASCTGTLPPANGDWVIQDTTYCEDGQIILNGNLTIKLSANLTLENVTLIMNTTGYQTKILAVNGSFVANYSNITAANTSEISDEGYQFYTSAGSYLYIRNSNVFHAGDLTSSIFSDELSNGIVMRGNNSRIENSSIVATYYPGGSNPAACLLAMSASNLTLVNNQFITRPTISLTTCLRFYQVSDSILIGNRINQSVVSGSETKALYLENAVNVSVKDSNISLGASGSPIFGIVLLNSISVNITNVTLQTTGDPSGNVLYLDLTNANNSYVERVFANSTIMSGGPYLDSSNGNTFFNNTFDGDGDDIFNLASSHDNRIVKNVIITNASSSNSFIVIGGRNNMFSNNTIFQVEGDTLLSLDSAYNSTISDNVMTLNCTSATNVIKTNTAGNNTISNNTIGMSCTGANNEAIDNGGRQDTIARNIILMSGTSTNRGILAQNDNTTILGNSITVIGSGNDNVGIQLFTIKNSHVINNTILTSGTNRNYGMYGACTNCTIIGNQVNASGTTHNNSGIAVNPISSYLGGNIISTNGNADSHGYFLDYSLYSVYANSTVFTVNSSSYGIYIKNSEGLASVSNNTFYNIRITASAASDVVVESLGTTNHFINVTFNQSNVTVVGNPSGNLNVSWFTRVFVNTSVQTALSGATVNVSSIATGLIAWSNVTSASGYSDWYITPGYIQNNSGIFSSQNHTFNASYPGLPSVSVMQNVTESMTVNITLTESACMNITTSGNYILNNNITSTGSCAQILTSDVLFDCAGYTLLFSTVALGNGINVSAINYSQLSNVTIQNCIIRQYPSGVLGRGIYFSNVTSSLIKNNTVFTNGSSANIALFLQTSSENNILENNIYPTGSGSQNIGILLSTNATGNNVSSNNISTSGQSSNVGIRIQINSTLNNVWNNTIRTTGTNSGNYGMWITSNGSRNNIWNNSITTFGSASNYGLILQADADYNIIENNSISTGGSSVGNVGIFIIGSSFNRLSGGSVLTSGTGTSSGLEIYSYASNNNISSMEITTQNTTAYGIQIQYTTTFSPYNNLLQNIRINASRAVDVYVDENSGTVFNTFLNVTFNYTDVTFTGTSSGNLNVSWYTRVFVNTSVQTALAGATVNVSSIATGVIAWSNVTPASGYSAWYITPGYLQNNSGIFSSQNLTFNASYPGLTSASVSQNVTESMTVNITLSESSCMNITASGRYMLSNNVTSPYTCMQITANDVELDCLGYTILYGTTGTGNGVNVSNAAVSNINNVSVRNCIITKVQGGGSTNYGIQYGFVSNGSIQNNSILTNGTSNNYGIYFLSGARNNSIEGNVIRTNGTQQGNIGVRITASSFNVVSNNSIITAGTNDNYGISTSGSSANNTIATNIVTSSGTSSNYGIDLSGTNASVFGNIINTVGTAGSNYGMFVSSSSNVITGNIITTSGTQSNIGLFVSSSNNAIISNTVRPTGTGADATGIYASSVSQLDIINNTILTSGSGTVDGSGNVGLSFSSVTYSRVTNNSINTTGFITNYGMYIYSSSNSNFSGGSVYSSGNNSYGIYLYFDSDNNRFRDLSVVSENQTSYAVYLRSFTIIHANPDNNLFQNIFLNASVANQIQLNLESGVVNHFMNTTFNYQNVSVIDGTLNVSWYTRVFVNTSLQTALAGAVVNVSSKATGLKAWSNITPASGYSDWYITPGYTQTSSGIVTSQNHTFNASATGYLSLSKSINVTESMTVNMTLSQCVGTDPPLNGDWIIQDTTHCQNIVIPLQGNLTVMPLANLTLDAVTLILNTSDARVLIINNSGTLRVNYSNITSTDGSYASSESYRFFTMPAAYLLLQNSFIYHAGDGSGTTPTYYGNGVNIQGNHSVLRNNTIQSANLSEGEKDHSDSFGVYATEVYNITAVGNRITTTGKSGYNIGIYLYSNIRNASVINNTIVTLGTLTNNHGVNIYSSSDTLVQGNVISTSGTTTNYGFFSDTGTNILLENNSITTSGTTTNNGIDLSSSYNYTIRNNRIQTQGTGSIYGLAIYAGGFNTVQNNTINATGTSTLNVGLLVSASSNNTVIDTAITTFSAGQSYGLLLDASSFNQILTSTARTEGTTDSYGVYLLGNTTFNEFTGITINTKNSTAYGLYIRDNAGNYPTNNTFRNTIFNATQANDVQLNAGSENTTNYFINVTFNYTNVSLGDGSLPSGQLDVAWLVRTFVNSTYLTSVAGANVTARANDNSIAWSNITDGSGYSDWYATTAYIQNNSGIFEKNNYTFSVFASSLPLYGTTTLVRNITESMTVNITMRDMIVPAILFVNPTIPNNTRTTNSSVLINVSLQNASDLSIMQFHWNGTNYSMYNDTLLLLYNFDNVTDLGENSTHVKDVSKWGNNGTCYNDATPGCTWALGGTYQRAMYFDGTNDWIDIPDINVGNSFSFEVWINASVMSNIGMIMTNTDTSDGSIENGFKFFINTFGSNDRRIVFETGNGASGADALSVAGNVTADRWHHIVVAVNRSQSISRIYINGRNMTDASTTRNDFGITGGSLNWMVGKTYIGGSIFYPFKGHMDNLQIWNYSLSDAEVAQHYYSTLYKYTNDTWVFWSNQTGIYQGNFLTGNERGNFSSGNYSFFAYSKDSSGNENRTELRTIAADTRAPDVSLMVPVFGFNTTTYNVTFMCNATDDIVLQNITLYVWNSSGVTLYTNTTNFSNTYSTLNMSYNLPGDAIYKWNCLGTDTFGNQLWSASGNNTVTYNARAAIAFVNPTIPNNTMTTNTSVLINVSVLNETDLKQFIWNWNGTNYSMYNNSLILMHNFDNVSALGENATVVKDLSAFGNNGTCDLVSGYCPMWNRSGRYGGTYEFDGSDDAITYSNLMTGMTSFTAITWLTINRTGTWDDIYAGQNQAGAWTGAVFQLTQTNVILTVYNNNAGSYDYCPSTSSHNIPPNTWAQIALSWESSHTMRLYINGQNVPCTYSSGGTPPTSILDASAFKIGSLLTYRHKGFLDEFRLLNRSLSIAEIQQQYYSNLYKFDVDKWAFWTNQTLNLTNRGVLTYQATVIDNIGNLNSTEQRQLTVLNTPPVLGPVILNTTLAMNSTLENLTFWITSANDTNRDSITNITNWFVNNLSITVLNLPFDTNVSTGTINATKDFSSYHRNVTLGNAAAGTQPTWNATGRVGGAYFFDGVNDFINLTNNVLSGTTAVTVTFWIKMAGSDATTQHIWSYDNNDAPEIRIIATNATTLNFVGYDSATYQFALGANMSLNEWHFVAGTWMSNDARFYIDGILQSNDSSVSITNTQSSTHLLGHYPRAVNAGLGNYTNATIDEFILYNRSLSAQQLYQLFIDGNRSKHATAIVAQEVRAGETWYVNVTPNDGFEDGTTVMSNLVTIRATQAPAIVNITTPALASIVEAGMENLTFGVTVEDNDTRLDVSDVNLTFSFESTSRINTSCRVDQQLSAVRQNYSCTVALWYFDPAGVWSVNATAVDLSGQVTPAYGTPLVVMETTAIAVGPSNITWSQLLPGMLNATAAVNITINNTGNKNITPKNITINATDLVGLINPAFYLPVTNFSIGADWLGDSECAVDTVANMTLNNTFVSIVGANLSRGNLSQGSGTAQEVLYLCLREVPTSMFGTAFVPQRYVSRREWILQVN